ncbi:MAG: hypothetical protein J7K40_01495 [candidate division Zixibacteria bacterium]|nr:hypothetical protein [candidate division Zixibacteria bacterium]
MIRLSLKENVSIRIRIVLILLILGMSDFAAAQWECRSGLAGHLKPIVKDAPIRWAVENTISFGKVDDITISNMQAFGGMELSFNKHQLFGEGGLKGWRTKQDDIGINKKIRLGLRELFYRYYTEKTSLTAGFQSLILSDYFLVNERAMAVNFNHNDKSYIIDAKIGSVAKKYSRYGTFCSVKYLYDIIPGRELPFFGNSIGETNFAGAVVSWIPSPKEEASKDITSEDDSSQTGSLDGEFGEFEDSGEFNEFEEFEDINIGEDKNTAGKKNRIVNQAGLIFYEEFGSKIDKPKYYVGALAEFDLPLPFTLETELLHQQIENNKALIYYLRMKNEHIWNLGNRTAWSLKYFGKYNIDDDASINTSFSNLFIGEAARLNTLDIPLYQAAVKHSFSKLRLHIKIQAVGQLKDDEISEIDFAIGKRFYNYFKLTGIFSRINAIIFNEPFYLARLELRTTF